jgi:NAD(P)-dependent dehydrogenase (short-subunit alcohol dehydrogenase family)
MRTFLVQRFDGKTVMVTGASSGIGLAVARRFAEEGAKVVCIARDKDRLEQAVAALPGTGHIALVFDAANEAEVDAAAAQLRAGNTVLYAAVFCAGEHMLRPLQVTKASHIDQLLAANVRSALLSTRLAVKLAAKEGASVVLVSSAAAYIGNTGEAVYAAAKGAIVSACRALAAELASKRIRVNAVAPGVVETPMSAQWLNQMSPQQKEAIRSRHLLGLGRPEDVADPILFLAGDEARWITGTCLTIDGGLTCH